MATDDDVIAEYFGSDIPPDSYGTAEAIWIDLFGNENRRAVCTLRGMLPGGFREPDGAEYERDGEKDGLPVYREQPDSSGAVS